MNKIYFCQLALELQARFGYKQPFRVFNILWFGYVHWLQRHNIRAVSASYYHYKKGWLTRIEAERFCRYVHPDWNPIPNILVEECTGN